MFYRGVSESAVPARGVFSGRRFDGQLRRSIRSGRRDEDTRNARAARSYPRKRNSSATGTIGGWVDGVQFSVSGSKSQTETGGHVPNKTSPSRFISGANL